MAVGVKSWRWRMVVKNCVTEMKSKSPVLSIIVPICGVEKYLHQCVDSILARTFRDFEVLLIDDGSMHGVA